MSDPKEPKKIYHCDDREAIIRDPTLQGIPLKVRKDLAGSPAFLRTLAKYLPQEEASSTNT